MSAWIIAAIALSIGFIPCIIVALRGDLLNRIVGLEMAGTLGVLILLLLAEGTKRPSFFDLAIALGLLSFPGVLIYVRLLGDLETDQAESNR